jgi:hypothetical protein
LSRAYITQDKHATPSATEKNVVYLDDTDDSMNNKKRLAKRLKSLPVMKEPTKYIAEAEEDAKMPATEQLKQGIIEDEQHAKMPAMKQPKQGIAEHEQTANMPAMEQPKQKASLN